MSTKHSTKATTETKTAAKPEKHCYCPDDCSCRRALWNPYVVAICGCHQH